MFSDLPKGVEAVDSGREVAAEEATFTLNAVPDAALVENHAAHVTIEGPNGMKATETLEISVKEKD
jgi:hypothetical protein